ncbi:MAG TPA: hypothetical protein VF546_12990 [Pyrinomonadaceae bacterium]|jgi:hypothetical protein
MFVIEFINNLGDVLEQGDVVVLSDKQGALVGDAAFALHPEVDLTELAHDTRVCGIVCSVKAGPPPPPAEESAAETAAAADAQAGVGGGKRSRAQKAVPVKAARRKPAAPAAEDQAKVRPGQIGLLVTAGAFAQCKADASAGPIKVGDLLTTSPTRGHAQKVTDPAAAVGAILGKALGPLKKGQGVIPVLVTLS